MSCKKCKQFESDDLEYFIVHLITTHGFRKGDMMEKYSLANWEYIEELLITEHATGKVSSYRFRKGPLNNE